MGLMHKLRILAGALAHKPFMPRTERIDLDVEGEQRPPKADAGPVPGPDLERMEDKAPDTERVADLIARQRAEEG